MFGVSSYPWWVRISTNKEEHFSCELGPLCQILYTCCGISIVMFTVGDTAVCKIPAFSGSPSLHHVTKYIGQQQQNILSGSARAETQATEEADRQTVRYARFCMSLWPRLLAPASFHQGRWAKVRLANKTQRLIARGSVSNV